MIYATTVVGKEFCDQYSKHINDEGANKALFVSTDHPELFPECSTRLYNREVFSYYDKLIFLIELVIEHKQRVTFIDADWFRNINENIVIDDNVVYSWHLFNEEELLHLGFYNNGIDLTKTLLEDNGFKYDNKLYPGEAILSVPYLDNIEIILTELKSLQTVWEKTFNKDLDLNHKSKRYSSYGVGYFEGGALYAVLVKNNIEVKSKDRDAYLKKSIM